MHVRAPPHILVSHLHVYSFFSLGIVLQEYVKMPDTVRPILGSRGMNLRWDVGTEEDGEKLCVSGAYFSHCVSLWLPVFVDASGIICCCLAWPAHARDERD